MSAQGPILIVSGVKRLPLAVALADCKLFPLIESDWTEANNAIARVMPAAVIADMHEAPQEVVRSVALRCARAIPYLPMIGIDASEADPVNVLPFSGERGFDHLLARLNAALRVRTLAAAVERRMAQDAAAAKPASDVLDEATVLLIGRGGMYPALSVALGARVAVVGAFSLDIAMRHLETRDLDGVVIGGGFSAGTVGDFLARLSGDARFRHLPVILTGPSPDKASPYDLANLEICATGAASITASALPLVRQNALYARLVRALKAIDSNGVIDAASGLMTRSAFHAEFANAIADSGARGASLSAARLAFDRSSERVQLDGARILSRLMRRFDFATLCEDGTILAAFAGTDLRQAHVIARRIASVVKHTLHAGQRDAPPIQPDVSVATMLPRDSADSILARLTAGEARKAS